MKFKNKNPIRNTAPWILVFCFLIFTFLSWILLFRDPRALIGISNLYPFLKTFLFSTQEYLSNYGLNSWPTILFALTAFFAIVSYVISLTIKISFKRTIIFAIVFQAITLLSFPILSTDIFSYIFSERVSTVHNENIWKVKPAAFPDDQFGVLADWKDTTSVYGGLHYLLYLPPAHIGQDNLLLLTILYKLIPAIFAFGTMYVLYLLLRTHESIVVERGLRLVFWNPLFILEILGSGHNDSMMIFLALLSYYFYKRKLWLLAGIVLALAVQVKLIPIVLFFFCLLALIRIKSSLAALIYLAGFVSINALAFSFMQVNIIDFIARVAYNGGVYWQSLPNLLHTFYPGGVVIIPVLFFVWLLFFIVVQWRNQTDPMYSYAVVLLVYLLFVSAAYWNWYALWILPLLPLINAKKIFITALVLTFTSLFAYPLLWVIHRINSPSPLWPAIIYLFIFTPPIMIYLCLRFRERFVLKIFKRLGIDDLIAQKGKH